MVFFCSLQQKFVKVVISVSPVPSFSGGFYAELGCARAVELFGFFSAWKIPEDIDESEADA